MILSNAKSLGNQSESEEMPSRKRMRNESDEETLTVSNEDIFSSSEEEGGKTIQNVIKHVAVTSSVRLLPKTKPFYSQMPSREQHCVGIL